jgi:hypothetical protein
MGCTGCNDGCFDESVQLALGPAGSDGSDGLYGGWSLKWKFDSNVVSGTGSSEVRLNNASPVSATVIYVNDDAFGTGAADVFLSSVTSAPYGRIKIFKEYDSTIFWLATITAADDTIVPAEVKFTVTDVVTNGSFTNGDDIVLTLAPAGATGATGNTGPAGADGVLVLYMDTTGPNTALNNATSAGTNLIRTDQIDGGTIGTVGDFIKIKGEVIADNVEGYGSTITIKFGGSTMLVWFAGVLFGSGFRFEIDLIVSNTNEIRPHIFCTNYKAGDRLNQLFYEPSFELGGVYAAVTSPITLSSNQNIEVEIISDGVNTTTLTYYEVTKYLKS